MLYRMEERIHYIRSDRPTDSPTDSLTHSRMDAFFGRINRPYSDLSGVLVSWSLEAKKMLVYEHEPETDGCNRIHCHILVIDSQATRKKLFERKNWKLLKEQLNIRGSEDFGFKNYEPGLKTIEYMSKGIYQPKLVIGYSPQEINDAKNNGYIKQDKQVTKKEKTHFDIIDEILKEVIYVECITRDDFGNQIFGKRIKDFDNVYDVLMKKLRENRIRTADYDINRWLTTIFRDDPYWGASLRENMRKKYSPV